MSSFCFLVELSYYLKSQMKENIAGIMHSIEKADLKMVIVFIK